MLRRQVSIELTWPFSRADGYLTDLLKSATMISPSKTVSLKFFEYKRGQSGFNQNIYSRSLKPNAVQCYVEGDIRNVVVVARAELTTSLLVAIGVVVVGIDAVC